VQRLTIGNGRFRSSNLLLVNPPNSATIVIRNTGMPGVQLFGYQGSRYSAVTMNFYGDSFSRLLLNGKPTPTFKELTPEGPASVAINGGSWWNEPGGFYQGTNTRFTVKNLRGYS
jgi:hypothetical protein